MLCGPLCLGGEITPTNIHHRVIEVHTENHRVDLTK